MNIEQEIKDIKDRNNRVESDKAWEISWVRRGFILAITYVFAFWWLQTIHEISAELKALVPTAGYLLSTLSLPAIKNIWLGEKNKKVI